MIEVQRAEDAAHSTPSAIERVSLVLANWTAEMIVQCGCVAGSVFERSITLLEEYSVAHAHKLAAARADAGDERGGTWARSAADLASSPERANCAHDCPARAHVTTADVKVIARRLSGRFTATDLAEAAGGSPMTIRKALGQLAEEGAVQRLGPAPNWSTKGRAPILYEVATGDQETVIDP